MFNNIYEHIRAAKIEAEKSYIRANTILIDEGLAKTNEMFIEGVGIVPPMIFGLEVKYVSKLSENYGINFALLNSNNTMNQENIRLKQEVELLQRKLDGLKELLNNE